MKALWTEGTFRSLLESAPDAMVIVDRQGIIVRINSQAEKVFGYDRDELLGQKIEILLPSRYHGSHVKQRNAYFETPRVRPMGAGIDLYARHKNGRDIPVEVSLSPLETSEGLLVTSAIRDISDRKAIEEQLRRARAEAEAANVAKSEFLANMSHEIRTPLAGILGYAEMLINYCKTDEQRRDYGKKVKRNADNLMELINDILDLSKVEAGALTVEAIPFNLFSEVECVLALFEEQAKEKGLTLETVVQRPVPQTLVSDPKRFRQILTNLVANAIKFTETGGVTLRIASATSESGKAQFAVTVTDTGCGISEAAQGILFNPFVQADSSTTRKYGGTGLGLSLSRRLAQALGGDLVLVKSTVGEGSSFRATIDSGEELAAQTASSEPLANASHDVQGIRVLLAEDHPDNLEVIERFLLRHGADVDIAHNGVEAVSMVTSQVFDLILMDMHMPVMDGYGAVRKIRETNKTIPIIAITANAMVEDREKCLAVGCTEFHSKPLDFPRLLNSIVRLTRANSLV